MCVRLPEDRGGRRRGDGAKARLSARLSRTTTKRAPAKTRACVLPPVRLCAQISSKNKTYRESAVFGTLPSPRSEVRATCLLARPPFAFASYSAAGSSNSGGVTWRGGSPQVRGPSRARPHVRVCSGWGTFCVCWVCDAQKIAAGVGGGELGKSVPSSAWPPARGGRVRPGRSALARLDARPYPPPSLRQRGPTRAARSATLGRGGRRGVRAGRSQPSEFAHDLAVINLAEDGLRRGDGGWMVRRRVTATDQSVGRSVGRLIGPLGGQTSGANEQGKRTQHGPGAGSECRSTR